MRAMLAALFPRGWAASLSRSALSLVLALAVASAVALVGSAASSAAAATLLDASGGAAGVIHSFAVTPTTLPAAGGTVELRAVVGAGSNCRFSSAALNLQATKACGSGRASMSVHVPKNKSKLSRQLTFLLATGTGAARKAVVTEYAVGAPRVTAQPQDQGASPGSTVVFEAAAIGKPQPRTQWQVQTGAGGAWRDVAGATGPNYSFTAANADNGWEYRAVFTNAGGVAKTRSAHLTVSGLSQIAPSAPAPAPASAPASAPVITLQPVSQAVAAGETVSLLATASGDPTPNVQWQISTDGGTTWGDVPSSPSTTYSFTAATSENGSEYRAVFTNSAGSATTTAALLTVAPTLAAPSVTVEPTSQGVTAGQTATFSAAASGNPTPSVQWQVSTDGGSSWSPVSGATAGSYSLTASSTEDGWEYRAVFANSQGSATTSSAVLTVSAPMVAPAVTTQPLSQTIYAGSDVTFDAAASGNPTPSVQWQISDNAGASWSDIPGATTPSYTLLVGIEDTGESFRALFTNAAGTAATTPAALNVQIYGSENWSGYLATGDTFSAVSASWTIPSVNC